MHTHLGQQLLLIRRRIRFRGVLVHIHRLTHAPGGRAETTALLRVVTLRSSSGGGCSGRRIAGGIEQRMNTTRTSVHHQTVGLQRRKRGKLIHTCVTQCHTCTQRNKDHVTRAVLILVVHDSSSIHLYTQNTQMSTLAHAQILTNTAPNLGVMTHHRRAAARVDNRLTSAHLLLHVLHAHSEFGQEGVA